MGVGEIILIVALGLIAAGCAIILGTKLYKALKEVVADKNWIKIISMIQDAVVAAEKSGASGADKKTQVIEAVKAACADVGIDATEYLDKIGEFIDAVIKTHNELDAAKTEVTVKE